MKNMSVKHFISGAKLFLITLIVMLLVNCMSTTSTSGRMIDETKISQILKQKTTIDDIISLFGAPQDQTTMQDTTIYLYKYCVSKGKGIYTGYTASSKTKEVCDELSVVFDKTGHVKTYSFQKGVQ